MRFLLDTHILIWWSDELSLLSKSARALLEDSNNQPIISTASLWEMQIKLAIGKLPLRLPLTLQHVLALENLPLHHKDPFDRLLIAQAQSENLPLLTADAVFEQYPIQRLS